MTDQSTSTDRQNRQLPPKRSGLPVLGSVVTFPRDPYDFYDELASYGDVVRFLMGTYEMATVFDPEEIAQVLVEDFEQYRKPDDADDLGYTWFTIIFLSIICVVVKVSVVMAEQPSHS
ncbi:cytochrome P450 [Halorubrum sp. BOL3-1]|uniref:cytochrome P450 n=1 Tax=Halorubrum sp. BOL3-1 TaxID=2497325 RepID=UPI001004EEE3|nr:cytochrome P450 [Halorubrum sp. BOL3-1]QAU11492.1 cytochrome P450 [Halorubrum sp. BOL3-1]